MRRIDVGCDLSYQVRRTTVFVFQISAAQTAHQRLVCGQFSIDPQVYIEICPIGMEGNQLQRIVVEPCELQITYRATVELTPEVEKPTNVGESNASQIPADVLTYLNPSRYCESDLLSKFAFEEFGTMTRGFGRVKAICEWVNAHLDYRSGSTNSTTTAADVLLQRTGVCRDYAHLAITLCRGVGIPARYVAGYAVDLQPPDFHGFFEAFLDGQWYLFDPTKLAPVGGLVRIGVGRDAADVSFATMIGVALMTRQSVLATESANNSDTVRIDTSQSAVSTA
ncbi:MAG: transglutaminase family protein [Fuerstia sp.]|nr:transglutaminase family protein [Fuerstiella sp.]